MAEHPRIETAILPAEPDPSQAIERAAGLLREGQVVAFPTDTVYGVGVECYARGEFLFRSKEIE